MNSYSPYTQEFHNYVPPEFEDFMNATAEEWVALGYICTRLVPRNARTTFGNISCEIQKKMHPYCNSLNVSKARKIVIFGTKLCPKYIH